MRSIWKGPFINTNILHEVFTLQKLNKKKTPIRITSKSSVIFPSFIGLTFSIFNGKKFSDLVITENMIGHKFGEFAVTKKYPIDQKIK